MGDKVDEYGLRLDGYDYYQHLKPIDGSGIFIGPNGKIADPLVDVFGKTKTITTESDTMIDRREQLEAIAMDTRAMPRDMQRVLDGCENDADGEQFEVLSDNFVVEAAKHVEGDEVERPAASFNFAAYLKRMMAEEDRKSSPTIGIESDEDCDDEDGEMVSSDFAVANKSAPREARLLDDHFDVVIGQYGDEEIGELDEDDPRLREGLQKSTPDNELLKYVLDDFENFDKGILDDVDMEDDIDSATKKDSNDEEGRVESAIAAAISKKGVVANGLATLGLDDDEEEEEEKEGNEDVESHSWFRRKQKAKWDCETVISTYSNLDNRPTTISRIAPGPRIRLSKKTGLPLPTKHERATSSRSKKRDGDDAVADVLRRLQIDDERSGSTGTTFDDAFESLAGAAVVHRRDRNETAAEKRERKRRVKAERRARRVQKKQTKSEYKKAGIELKKHEHTDKLSGRSVRRLG